MTMSDGSTNIYMVGTGSHRILIDAGQGMDAFKSLLVDTLSKAHVKGITDILVTHRHYDHIGGIQQVVQVCEELYQTKPTVWKHLTDRDKQDPMQVVYHNITHGQRFHTEGATLEAYYTPGHSDDHMCFRILEDNSLLAGDNVLGRGSSVFENLNQYLHSLHVMKDLQPTQLYCGHGPVVAKGVEKIQEYIDHRMAREREIVALMKTENRPWKADDLVKIIYKDYPVTLHKPAEHGQVLRIHDLRIVSYCIYKDWLKIK